MSQCQIGGVYPFRGCHWIFDVQNHVLSLGVSQNSKDQANLNTRDTRPVSVPVLILVVAVVDSLLLGDAFPERGALTRPTNT